MILGRKDIDITNASKSQAKSQRILAIVKEMTRTRVRYDLGDWTTALQTAESRMNPSRTLLYDIIDNIVLDPHLTAVMNKVKKQVDGKNLIAVRPDGTEDEAKTAIFTNSWVTKFIDLAIESKFFGFSLIQLGNLKNDAFDSVELVPRRHVRPENQTVLKHTTDSITAGIDYTKSSFSKWLVPVGEPRDLGLLTKAAPHVLWKMRAMASWAVFAEVFGMPIRIGKTNATDENARNQMAQMLKNMGSSTWGVFDEDEAIEMIQTNQSDAYQVYLELIELCNKEISKLFLGQTMTTEDGSSLSQANVHKEVENEIIMSYMKFVENVINDQLIPKMIGLGVAGLRNITVQFDLSDKMHIKDMFEIDKELLKYYNIPVEYIREKYGTEVEEKQAPVAPVPPPTEPAPNLPPEEQDNEGE